MDKIGSLDSKYFMRHFHISEFLFALFVILLLASCHSFVTEGTRERIAFSKHGSIWVMNADGTGLHELLKPATSGLEPKWSPDGGKISFSSENADGKWSVWVADANGDNLLQVSPAFDYTTAVWLNSDTLLTEVITDTGQAWNNPVGEFILSLQNQQMTAYADDYAWKIPFRSGNSWLSEIGGGLVLNSLGEDPKTGLPEYGVGGPYSFDVSPSGDEVAFYGSKGSGAGTRLLYAVFRSKIDCSETNESIKLVEIDGSAQVRWSPDGKWIAVLDQKGQLQIIDAGTNLIARTFQTEFGIGGPQFQWGPDSQWLLGVVGDSNGQVKLFKINRDTGETLLLASDADIVSSPDWGIVRQ